MAVISYFIAFMLVALLVYVLRYSGRLRFQLESSFPVAPDALAAAIGDFETWRQWNPWQDHDSMVVAHIERDGLGKMASFSWQSTRTAKVLLAHDGVWKNGRLVQHFQGSAPFSFKGKLIWAIAADGAYSKLDLSFKGRVGFAQRAFSKTVQKMLSLDFGYALNKLKIHFAQQSASSNPGTYQVEYLGLASIAPRVLVTKDYEGLAKNIGMALQPLIAEMKAECAQGNPLVEAEVHYLQTNLKTGITKCKYGIEIQDAENAASHYRCVPAQARVIRLRGDLQGLEVAWYLAMQQIRASGDQPDQRIPPFERYHYQSASGMADVAYVDLYFPIVNKLSEK